MPVTISPEDRARLDPVFMQVVLAVQAEAQQSKPEKPGNLAAMFHREQVAEALQGCAMLIAGWNAGRVDEAGVSRAGKALRGLGLGELAERVEKLPGIAGTDLTGASAPNRAKQQRYARAHERLQLALEYGFYIEAAMICESIISDRLHSHLHWRIELMRLDTLDGVLDRLAGMKVFRSRRPELSLTRSSTLFALIKAVELDFNDLGKPHYLGLPQRLDDWRGLRNRITHNITYTRPSHKTYEEVFEAFMAAARTCALEGQTLTGQLTNWDRAVRRWHEGAARRRTGAGPEPG